MHPKLWHWVALISVMLVVLVTSFCDVYYRQPSLCLVGAILTVPVVYYSPKETGKRGFDNCVLAAILVGVLCPFAVGSYYQEARYLKFCGGEIVTPWECVTRDAWGEAYRLREIDGSNEQRLIRCAKRDGALRAPSEAK